MREFKDSVTGHNPAEPTQLAPPPVEAKPAAPPSEHESI
jgi:hypothetical protein